MFDQFIRERIHLVIIGTAYASAGVPMTSTQERVWSSEAFSKQ